MVGCELSEECAYRQTPTLWLASSAEEMQIAEEKYQRLTARCPLPTSKRRGNPSANLT